MFNRERAISMIPLAHNLSLLLSFVCSDKRDFISVNLYVLELQMRLLNSIL